MKKLFILFLLCGLYSSTFSQVVQDIGGNPRTRARVRGTLQVDSGLVLPVRADTNYIPYSEGTVIYNSRDKQLYLYGGGRWQLSSSGDSTIVPIDSTLRVDSSGRLGVKGGLATGTSYVMRLEFVIGTTSGAPAPNSTTYTNTNLIGKAILDISLEGMPISFIARSGVPYFSFVSSTGTLTLNNGSFANDEWVRILFKEKPVGTFSTNSFNNRDFTP